MKEHEFQRYRRTVVIFAAILMFVSLLGVIDIRTMNYSGYTLAPTNMFTAVAADSPAEQAGFKVGDRLLSINGLDADDIWARVRQPRPEIGETRAHTVQRGDEEISMELTYAGLPLNNLLLNLSFAVVGFAFLISGLVAFRKVQSLTMLRLSLGCLGFGMTFINPLYFEAYGIRTFYNTTIGIMTIFGVALILHFLLSFPNPRPVLERKLGLPLLYALPVLLSAFLLFVVIFNPSNFSRPVFGALSGGYFGIYLLLGIITVVRAFLRASSEARAAHGLRWMLYGILGGFIPGLLAILVNVITPGSPLPGAPYYFLSMVLIPISFAWAALKRAGIARPTSVAEPVAA